MAAHQDDRRQAIEEIVAATPDDAPVEVLLHPVGRADRLRQHLAELAATSEVAYNVLDLANVIAVRAPKSVLLELATHPEVAAVSPNPTFGTQGASN